MGERKAGRTPPEEFDLGIYHVCEHFANWA
jgi:hypothetical protein